MIGDTLIYEPEKSKLVLIAEDMDALDDFAYVDLELLKTTDFVEIFSSIGEDIDWFADGEPVVFDEEGGLAIISVSPKAIDYLLSVSSTLSSDFQPDISLIKSFVEKHGRENIYHLSTF